MLPIFLNSYWTGYFSYIKVRQTLRRTTEKSIARHFQLGLPTGSSHAPQVSCKCSARKGEGG